MPLWKSKWLCDPSNTTNLEQEDPDAMENFQTEHREEDKHQELSKQSREVTLSYMC